MRAWPLIVLGALGACMHEPDVDDNWRARMDNQCRDRAACEALQRSILEKRNQCHWDNKNDCAELDAQLREADRHLGALQAQAQQTAEARERAEWQKREDERRREEAARAAEAKAKADEESRRQAIVAWRQASVARCAAKADASALDPAPADAKPDEIEATRAACAAAPAERRRERLLGAFDECLELAWKHPSAKLECTFDDDLARRFAEADLKDALSNCTTMCRANGVRFAKIQAQQASYHARHVRCCDESRSPRCSYGGAFVGCCAGHGGVCAEEGPDPPPLTGKLPTGPNAPMNIDACCDALKSMAAGEVPPVSTKAGRAEHSCRLMQGLIAHTREAHAQVKHELDGAPTPTACQ